MAFTNDATALPVVVVAVKMAEWDDWSAVGFHESTNVSLASVYATVTLPLLGGSAVSEREVVHSTEVEVCLEQVLEVMEMRLLAEGGGGGGSLRGGGGDGGGLLAGDGGGLLAGDGGGELAMTLTAAGKDS